MMTKQKYWMNLKIFLKIQNITIYIMNLSKYQKREKGNSMNNSDRKTNSSGKGGKEELTLSQKVESGTYETSGKAAKSDLNKTAESKSK